ncbi:MAG: hypothetical protein IJ659_08080 [Alloprevotella sp.]|nr:hypothetical protein [Alloprevotella sp.]
MKKFFFTLALLLPLSLCVSMAAVPVSNDDIYSQWRTTTIPVRGGAASPDVITLLRASQQVFPMWSAEQVLLAAATLRDGEQYESTDDWRVLVDRKNGYCDLDSQTDVSQVKARVWRRRNGHSLFALSLFEIDNQHCEVLCWYDYDPATRTLTPERSPVDDLRAQLEATNLDLDPRTGYTDVTWSLPMSGDELEVWELRMGFPCVTHIYTWDGMRHTPNGERITEFGYRIAGGDDAVFRAWLDGYKYYAWIDPTGEGSSILWLSKGKSVTDEGALFGADDYGELLCVARTGEDFGPLTFTLLPPIPTNTTDSPTVAIAAHDQAGGAYVSLYQWMSRQAVIIDLPDILNGGRTIELIEPEDEDRVIQAFYEEATGEEITVRPVFRPFTFVEDEQ